MKKLLIVSLFINCIFLFFIGKRVYYTSHYKIEKSGDPFAVLKRRVQLFKSLPVDSTDIVFIGDSQIQFFELAEMFHDIRIKNRGIAGDCTKNVLNRLQDVITGKPDKLFIEVGVNDALLNVPIDTAVSQYEKILNTISLESTKTKVYVISIMPVSASYIKQNAVILQMNNLLKRICLKHNVQYVDVYPGLSKNSSLNQIYGLEDGVHLNGPGYLLLRKLLAKYI